MDERLNSRLEWQGAEFLVLAHMLIEKIEAYKPYVNHPNYDLVALGADGKRTARISVKSRWATNRAGWFSLGSIDCDFVVHVALNRGVRRRKRLVVAPSNPPVPLIYVFPADICAQVRTASGKINIKKIPDAQHYLDRWELVREHLGEH